MEDPRISRMYLALLKKKTSDLRNALWRAAVLRSGVLTAFVLLIAIGFVVFVVKQRGTGHLTRIRSELAPKPLAPGIASPQPGGQDPIILQRFADTTATVPEFLSATFLPGRGMNLLQITAFLPDRGEVNLLDSESLNEATRDFTGTGDDAGGARSLTIGAPFELPWAGSIFGTLSAQGNRIATQWHGHTLSLPAVAPPNASPGGGATATGGLLLMQKASSVKTNVMPDGGDAQATFAIDNADQRWPSHTEASMTVLLSSRSMELTIVARNTGTEAEPLGIGWLPRFLLPSGDRKNALLHLPVSQYEEIRDSSSHIPTGKMLPVEGTSHDFTGRGGVRLGPLGLDDTFMHLKSGLLDNGPIVELRDTASDYGLRLTLLSPAIQALRVTSPANSNYVLIEPRFNVDDPFGREWSSDQDTGMIVLQPGQTAQWKIRLELFSLSAPVPGQL